MKNVFLTLGAFTLTTSLIAGVCPNTESFRSLSQGEVEDFLKDNRIVMVNQVDREHLLNFHKEFQKFPSSLMEEMLTMKADIHILQGTGVMEDPTWEKEHVVSGSGGRGWDIVPGSGGFPYFKMAGGHSIPTRIVVNQLYNTTNEIGGHGSENLFLHEHGHSLDSLYDAHDISATPKFRMLFSEENLPYLRSICPTHCFTKDGINYVEAFAETFTHYNACDASRINMERKAPEIADFFVGFNSVKDYKIQENHTKGLNLIPKVETEEPREEDKLSRRHERETVRTQQNPERRSQEQPQRKKRRSIGRFFKDLVEDIEDIFD